MPIVTRDYFRPNADLLTQLEEQRAHQLRLIRHHLDGAVLMRTSLVEQEEMTRLAEANMSASHKHAVHELAWNAFDYGRRAVAYWNVVDNAPVPDIHRDGTTAKAEIIKKLANLERFKRELMADYDLATRK